MSRFQKIFYSVVFISLMPSWATAKTIVSANYLQMVKCFPVLKEEGLKTAMTLDQVKQQVDLKFPSLQPRLLTRDIFFKTPQGQLRVLRLKTKPQNRFEMILESIDEKGVYSPLPLSRRVGTQEDINQILRQAETQKDERTFDDTKPNGHKLSYKTSQDSVQELVFRASNKGPRLYCYVKEGLGPLCLCK